MKVPLLDLKLQYQSLKNELDEAVLRVAESQYFILGPEVENMEKEFCEYLGCKYAIPIMKKQGGGVIINTASVSGVRARPGLSAYTASKGAAILLTRGLAIELAPHQIRVNCLNPVAADTPMLPKFIDDSGAMDKKYEDAKQRFIDTVPMGRVATAQDVARAALFLASDDASFITAN